MAFLIRRIFSAVTLTPACESRLTKITTDSNFLRLSVVGGEGCSGFTYNFEIDTEKEPEDVEFGKLVIDSGSLDLIDGSTIDYADEMVKKMFIVKSNPQASLTCGCGVSFSPKAFS